MSLYHALAGVPAFARVKSFMQLVLDLTGPKGVRPSSRRGALDRSADRAGRARRARRGSGASLSEHDGARARARDGRRDRRRAARRSARPMCAPRVGRSDAERAELPSSWDELLRFG